MGEDAIATLYALQNGTFSKGSRYASCGYAKQNVLSPCSSTDEPSGDHARVLLWKADSANQISAMTDREDARLTRRHANGFYTPAIPFIRCVARLAPQDQALLARRDCQDIRLLRTR